MKRCLLLFAMLLPVMLKAQSPASTAYRIPLSTYVYNEGSLNLQAQTALERKLGAMATTNGYGSTSGDFLLAAEAAVVDLQSTATVPVKYVANVEVQMAVINTIERIVVGSEVFSLKGVGVSDEQAALSAINQLNPKAANCVSFMSAVRVKMETYYKYQLPNIKAKAESASQRGDYEGALAILGVVPESLPEYPEIAELMTSCYQRLIDREAAELMQKAKAAYAKRDYAKALELLASVSPLSNKVNEANKLTAEITAFYEQKYQQAEKERLEDRERMIQERKEDRADAREFRKDENRLEELRIQCAKETAIAKAGIASEERQSRGDFFRALIAAVLK